MNKLLIGIAFLAFLVGCSESNGGRTEQDKALEEKQRNSVEERIDRSKELKDKKEQESKELMDKLTK